MTKTIPTAPTGEGRRRGEGMLAGTGTPVYRKTVVIIAHRFSTLRQADRIVVIEDGRIVGQGSHEELMANNYAYQRLYQREWAGRGLGS